MKYRVPICFLALIVTSSDAAAKDTKVRKKQEAWSNFRGAFLKRDFKKMATLATFPIEVKGNMDEDPVLNVTEQKFRSCFLLIYKEDVGLSAAPESHEAYITKHPSLTKLISNGKPISDEPGEAGFRVASLVFSSSSFKLEGFNLDTADSAIRKKCE